MDNLIFSIHFRSAVFYLLPKENYLNWIESFYLQTMSVENNVYMHKYRNTVKTRSLGICTLKNVVEYTQWLKNYLHLLKKNVAQTWYLAQSWFRTGNSFPVTLVPRSSSWYVVFVKSPRTTFNSIEASFIASLAEGGFVSGSVSLFDLCVCL